MSIQSKKALDRIIHKSRVHLYKPIQIAEILYHYRKGEKIKLLDLETYRNTSKKWRDRVTSRLVGRVCTSSQKFQDNLFEPNALPPKLLNDLAEFNNKNNGLVENYIYHKLYERINMVFEVLDYIEKVSPKKFELNKFLDFFIYKPGLKRSIDKAYEITVYALFSAIVGALKIEVSLSIGNVDKDILRDFGNFTELVLGVPKNKNSISMPAKLFRAGVTNAADRGLDIWANFGTAIQVKHISLSEDIAEGIFEASTSDKFILVCLDADAKVIERVLKQLPSGNGAQRIITIAELKKWYGLCFSNKYRGNLGKQLLGSLIREFHSEFPSSKEITPFLKERGYDSSQLKGVWAF